MTQPPHALAFLLTIASFLLLPACGGKDRNTTVPAVVSSAPANNAQGVSRIADLTVTMSKALDAAAVTGANVRLTCKNSRGCGDVTATVSYEAATNTIRLNPTQPLSPNTDYTLTLANVQDSAGNVMASTAIAFTTYVNPVSQSIAYTATGDVASYTASSYDANGNQTRYAHYEGAGTDGVWFTADDVASYYFASSYDANGNRTRNASYEGAGTDGVWFTADDVASYYSDSSYDANGNPTRHASYIGAGMDGVWFTADDVVLSQRIYDPRF